MTGNVSALFDRLMLKGDRIGNIPDARARIAQAFLPHRWDIAGAPGDFELLHGELRLGGLAINAVSYNREVAIDSPPFGNFLCIHFSARGECAYRQGARAGWAGEQLVYVSGPDQNFRQEMSAGYRQVTIKVQRRALEDFIASETGRPLGVPLSFSPDPQPIDGDAGRLLRALTFLCGEYGEGEGRPPYPLMDRQAGRMIMAALLTALPNSYRQHCLSRESTALPYYVKRADQFILAHLGEAMDLDRIASASGVSRRTLSAAFRTHFGTSVMAHVRLRRLQMARDELARTGDSGRSIADIAYACGFNHLSRFAADYAAMFGEAPSVTRRTGGAATHH